MHYVGGIPPVSFDGRTMLAMLDGDAARTATHIHTDPVTGVAMVSVYFDDGHGNGNCLFAMPLAELRAINNRLT